MSKKRTVLSPNLFAGDYLACDRLSRAAAYEVALKAVERSALVSRIEGGIWRDPGFMPRTNCIWDALLSKECSLADARQSNADAANFIAQAHMEIETFILSFTQLEEPE